MKKLRFTLMLLITLPVMVQAQNWTGVTSNDWDDGTNWSTGIVPVAGNDVTIPNIGFSPVVNGSLGSPDVCNNLTIAPGAVLTIISAKALTVNGTLTNNNAKGIVIESDENGTGSLIINGTGAGGGTLLAQRYMTIGGWHMVSSPLSGQTVANFLSNNIKIPKNGVNNRGMMDYDPANNKWNNFFTTGAGNGNLGAGKGFSVRTVNNSAVTFTGPLQSGLQTVTTLGGFWNCIGNPYTSAIGINTASSSTAKFINVNIASLDEAYGAVYIWDQPDAQNGVWGKYTVISNVPVPDVAFDVQQGQAFFVKMKAGANTIDFTSAMQIHLPTLPLKSTGNVWPTIKLESTVGSQKSSTIIAFNSEMTKGLDPTYDAGLLKGGSDLIVYSKLVEDNGISFAIQALPDNNYKTMVIPIGLEFKTGGEVVFSAELLNLPSDCKVILEDKVSKSFTDLSKDNYKVAIAANSVVADRFQLHTSNIISELGDETLAGKLKAYAIRNMEIRVVGEVSNNAVATLYNVQGSMALIENLKEGSLNVIPTPNIKTGIYMLSVKDHGQIQTFKLLIRE